MEDCKTASSYLLFTAPTPVRLLKNAVTLNCVTQMNGINNDVARRITSSCIDISKFNMLDTSFHSEEDNEIIHFAADALDDRTLASQPATNEVKLYNPNSYASANTCAVILPSDWLPSTHKHSGDYDSQNISNTPRPLKHNLQQFEPGTGDATPLRWPASNVHRYMKGHCSMPNESNSKQLDSFSFDTPTKNLYRIEANSCTPCTSAHTFLTTQKERFYDSTQHLVHDTSFVDMNATQNVFDCSSEKLSISIPCMTTDIKISSSFPVTLPTVQEHLLEPSLCSNVPESMFSPSQLAARLWRSIPWSPKIKKLASHTKKAVWLQRGKRNDVNWFTSGCRFFIPSNNLSKEISNLRHLGQFKSSIRCNSSLLADLSLFNHTISLNNLATDMGIDHVIPMFEAGIDVRVMLRTNDVAVVVNGRLILEETAILEIKIPTLILESSQTKQRRVLLLDNNRLASTDPAMTAFLKGAQPYEGSEEILMALMDNKCMKNSKRISPKPLLFVSVPVLNTPCGSLILILHTQKEVAYVMAIVAALQTYHGTLAHRAYNGCSISNCDSLSQN